MFRRFFVRAILRDWQRNALFCTICLVLQNYGDIAVEQNQKKRNKRMKKLITLAAMFAATCLFAQDNAQQNAPQNAGTAAASQQTPTADDGAVGVIEIVEISATDTCGCTQCDSCKGKFCKCDQSTPQCAKCCKTAKNCDKAKACKASANCDRAKNCPDDSCPKTAKCK